MCTDDVMIHAEALCLIPQEGLSSLQCVHMRDHKNAIKGPFFEDERDSRESQKG